MKGGKEKHKPVKMILQGSTIKKRRRSHRKYSSPKDTSKGEGRMQKKRSHTSKIQEGD